MAQAKQQSKFNALYHVQDKRDKLCDWLIPTLDPPLQIRPLGQNMSVMTGEGYWITSLPLEFDPLLIPGAMEWIRTLRQTNAHKVQQVTDRGTETGCGHSCLLVWNPVLPSRTAPTVGSNILLPSSGYSVLKMAATCSYEQLIKFYHSAHAHIKQDSQSWQSPSHNIKSSKDGLVTV
jgi:hypothetical protein